MFVHKPKITEIPYEAKLAHTIFEACHHLPWAMLLSSADSCHANSRFDIVALKPLITVETCGANSEISQQGKVTHSTTDPFTLLRELQAEHLPYSPEMEDIPFCGGWLGYFGYDLGRQIENIPNIAKHDIDAPDLAVGLYESALIIDHKLKQAYWVGEVPNIESETRISKGPFKLTSQWQPNMSKAAYIEKFDRVQEYLSSGDCYQINLAQRFKAQFVGDEWQAYKTLEHENCAPFSAFIRLSEHAIISISPERFLQCHRNQVETKPIKGTRPRFKDPSLDQAQIDDLKTASKDQAENLMIVDLLRNDIGRVCAPGTVKVPTLFDIESFPAVHHLVSTITGELDQNYDVYDLIRACFPGGSITGAPKVRAMQIIEELEPHRRNVYCGSIGYISRCGNIDTSITIRTLISQQGTLYAWAGGGLVADSQADAEYQETLDKLGKILPILS
ncbi:aminodeoxychorismate synthase component I [Vibrio gallicus]|uniref:aminodeoxychorismate synthase component I n=1 Tax=Vibrio gallicus TaxID=190897 RepID=UPI0021C33BFC|nr:aminodeoxychorismate synthase component I [Vibrio gallicus]